MNQKEYIQKLMLKFSRNRCNQAEIEELVQYFLKNPEETVLPEEWEVLHPELYRSIQTHNGNHLFKQIEKKIQNKKVKQLRVNRNNLRVVYGVAAILILILGCAFYFGFIENEWQPYQAPITTANEIILEREDGKIEKISEEGQLQLTDKNGKVIGDQRGNQLIYQNGMKASEELVYNTLKIPYGKRFEVQLSDGTLVMMNSGSSLRYPVNFSKMGNREVILTGEAFFSVAKDKDRAFIVKADELEIGVLGTEFNVSAYPEDPEINVVLVEGSVELSVKGDYEKSILQPGQLASVEQSDNTLEIREVDTEIYTAWMKGGLVFRNMTFSNMLKKMERHYDVVIMNRATELGREKFNASFGNEPIEKILKYFQETYGLEYTQQKNIIIIKDIKSKV
ncbi:FecR domain-containing protein [Salinimicrobium sp. TIG7-5_MAKvit]|uniref:FecR family protein n=1 Tax=Salinimicrobium sp. TIG7-5_MAKvit TaxID=3121289 RepID=UPI003C6E1B90